MPHYASFCLILPQIRGEIQGNQSIRWLDLDFPLLAVEKQSLFSFHDSHTKIKSFSLANFYESIIDLGKPLFFIFRHSFFERPSR